MVIGKSGLKRGIEKMTKIICACCHCKFNSNGSICEKEEAHFEFHIVQTQFNGQQEFLKCKDYVETDDETYQKFKKYLEGRL